MHHALSNDTHRVSAAAGWVLQSLVASPVVLSLEGFSANEFSEEDLLAALDALVDLAFAVRQD